MQLPLEAFHVQREQLFQHGPTGLFPLEDAAAQLRHTPRPTVCEVLTQASMPLLQPRCGVGDHAKMIELLQFLEQEGGPAILSVTIDSYTRLNLYDKAAQSRNLNGYPLVTHGITGGRELVQAVQCPLQVRHGSPDGRLLAEITYASGITAFEGGGISYNLPYSKAVPLRQSLRHWQYIDRLTGLLSTERSLDRETFGPLTSVLMPPSLSIAISILETLLAVEQGVRCVTIGYPETGALVQDIAALRTIIPLCCKHLRSMGFPIPQLFISFHQWMGVFPRDQVQALALIAAGVMTAVVGHTTKIITKTPQEALGIPTPEANAATLRFCNELIRYGASWRMVSLPMDQIEEESYWIAREVDELLEAVYNLSIEDLVESIVLAFEMGWLDIPFAPSRYVQSAVMPARDADGAIRYLEMGKLPLSDAARAFHQQKLAGKSRQNIRSIVDDIYYLAQSRKPQDQDKILIGTIY